MIPYKCFLSVKLSEVNFFHQFSFIDCTKPFKIGFTSDATDDTDKTDGTGVNAIASRGRIKLK